MKKPGNRVLVLGLGNPDRGDDGVGLIVAQRLAGRLPAGARLLTRSGDMLDLIVDWDNVDVLVCVDAAAPIGTPGRIHHLDLSRDTLPHRLRLPSSHAMGLLQVLELARALQLAPRRVTLYAIEGACFATGAPLTPAVAEAAVGAAERIVVEVKRLLGVMDRPLAAFGDRR